MKKILGGLSLFLALGMIFKGIDYLGMAFKLSQATSAIPFKQQYLAEYLLTFAINLSVGFTMGWWGITRFRKQKPDIREIDL